MHCLHCRFKRQSNPLTRTRARNGKKVTARKREINNSKWVKLRVTLLPTGAYALTHGTVQSPLLLYRITRLLLYSYSRRLAFTSPTRGSNQRVPKEMTRQSYVRALTAAELLDYNDGAFSKWMHRFGERDIGRHLDEHLGLEEVTIEENVTTGRGSQTTTNRLSTHFKRLPT
jgi:hypothetical protein